MKEVPTIPRIFFGQKYGTFTYLHLFSYPEVPIESIGVPIFPSQGADADDTSEITSLIYHPWAIMIIWYYIWLYSIYSYCPIIQDYILL